MGLQGDGPLICAICCGCALGTTWESCLGGPLASFCSRPALLILYIFVFTSFSLLRQVGTTQFFSFGICSLPFYFIFFFLPISTYFFSHLHLFSWWLFHHFDISGSFRLVAAVLPIWFAFCALPFLFCHCQNNYLHIFTITSSDISDFLVSFLSFFYFFFCFDIFFLLSLNLVFTFVCFCSIASLFLFHWVCLVTFFPCFVHFVFLIHKHQIIWGWVCVLMLVTHELFLSYSPTHIYFSFIKAQLR